MKPSMQLSGDLNLRQIPVEEALRLARVLFRVEPQRVLITTAEKVRADLVTAVFPVKDILERLRPDPGSEAPQFNLPNIGNGATAPQFTLANIDATAPQFNLANIGANVNVGGAGGGGGGLGGLFTVPGDAPVTDQMGVAELINLIRQHVNATEDPAVAPWNSEGGNAEMTCKDDVLWVKQTREGQAQVGAMLARLRAGFAAGSISSRLLQLDDNDEPEETLATRRLLDTRIDIDFERTSLDNVLKYIGELRKVNIVISPDIAAEGIDLSSRLVTLSGKGATVRSILFHIMGSDLGYDVRPGYLLVTTRSKLQSHLPVRTYDITPLLEQVVAVRPLPGGRAAVEVIDTTVTWGSTEIISILKQNVNGSTHSYVAQWSDEGGPAVIQYLNGMLIMSQTPRGHQEVAKMLGRLVEEHKAMLQDYVDQARGKPAQFRLPAYTVPDDAAPEDKAVLEQLERPVNFQFADRPLAEVIEMIRQAAPDVNIIVSPDVAAEGINIDSRRVTLNASNAPVGTVLARVLGDDLGWRVKEGWVEITTRARLQQNLPVVTYPVQDLIPGIPDYGATAPQFNLANIGNGPTAPQFNLANIGGNSGGAAELINTLKQTVNATADKEVAQWSDEGGPAVMQFLNGMLIISQTRHGHQRLCDCLNRLLRDATTPGRRQASGQ